MVRAALVGALVFAVWVGSASYQFFQRTGAIDSEIRQLEAAAQRIDRENATLREKIEYFSSDSFEEREAKEKLGLKRIGESVVAVKTFSDTEIEGQESAILTISTGRTVTFRLPNYYKWWKILFADREVL